MTEAIAVQPNSLDIVMGADMKKIQDQLKAITSFQNVVQKTLMNDQDYGIIPGTNKPTLLKPGAEKIIMLMGLTSTYEIVEKVEDYEEGFFAYTVKSSLFKGDQLITQGFGSANTKETRYRLNEKEEGTNKKVWKGAYQDPYTLVNTVLKMAKKRAQVDASLTVGSLSNIFTQDMEDLSDLPNNAISSPDDPVINFGKYRGKTVSQIYSEDKGYVKWLSEDAKNDAIKQAAIQIRQNNRNETQEKEETQAVNDRVTDEQVKRIEAISRQMLAETGEDIIHDWNATEYHQFTQDKAEQFIGLAEIRLEEYRKNIQKEGQGNLFDPRRPYREPSLTGASNKDLPF